MIVTRNQTACVAIVLSLMSSSALAQQQTIYGPDGRVTGRVTTDSQSSTTIYGADGRAAGRATTGSGGAVTVYDASGNRVGTVAPKKRERR